MSNQCINMTAGPGAVIFEFANEKIVRVFNKKAAEVFISFLLENHMISGGTRIMWLHLIGMKVKIGRLVNFRCDVEINPVKLIEKAVLKKGSSKSTGRFHFRYNPVSPAMSEYYPSNGRS